MSYTVAARDDQEIQEIEDDRQRRAVIACCDLLQTHLREFATDCERYAAVDASDAPSAGLGTVPTEA